MTDKNINKNNSELTEPTGEGQVDLLVSKKNRLVEKMKKARLVYELSQDNMSQICGFGKNTWGLYERGEAEIDGANKIIVEMAVTPLGMMKLLEICPKVRRKGLEMKIHKIFARLVLIKRDLETSANQYLDDLDWMAFDD